MQIQRRRSRAKKKEVSTQEQVLITEIPDDELLEAFIDRNIEALRKIHVKKGATYMIYASFTAGFEKLTFKQIHEIYKAVAGVSSKGSTGRILRWLTENGFLEKAGRGIYKLPEPIKEMITTEEGKREILELLSEALDKRALKSTIKHRMSRILKARKGELETKEEEKKIPKSAKKVIAIAQSLIKEGKKAEAIDLIAHTLLPIRKTGLLIARKGDIFIYYERKTGKMHLLKSKKLAEIFEQLGITDELLYYHYGKATKLIKKLFGSHQNARRVHYHLKELGWFEYPFKTNYMFELTPDVEIPTILLINQQPQWILRIFKLADKRELLRIQIPAKDVEELSKKVKKKGQVVTREHVKEQNEESYFYRTGGLL